MNKFRELLQEAKATDLVKILNKYDATIALNGKVSKEDVVKWGEGSIMYSDDEGYADAFDMKVKKFEKFAQDVIDNAAEIAQILSK